MFFLSLKIVEIFPLELLGLQLPFLWSASETRGLNLSVTALAYTDTGLIQYINSHVSVLKILSILYKTLCFASSSYLLHE